MSTCCIMPAAVSPAMPTNGSLPAAADVASHQLVDRIEPAPRRSMSSEHKSHRQSQPQSIAHENPGALVRQASRDRTTCGWPDETWKPEATKDLKSPWHDLLVRTFACLFEHFATKTRRRPPNSALRSPNFMTQYQWARTQRRAGTLTLTEARSITEFCRLSRRGAPTRGFMHRLWDPTCSDRDIANQLALASDYFGEFWSATEQACAPRSECSTMYTRMRLGSFLGWALLTDEEANHGTVPTEQALHRRLTRRWLITHPDRQGALQARGASRDFAYIESARVREKVRWPFVDINDALDRLDLYLATWAKEQARDASSRAQPLRQLILDAPAWVR